MGVTSWLVEEKIRRAQLADSGPAKILHNWLLIPESAHSIFLQWDHSSKLTCDLSLAQTLHLLHQKFWWPSMLQDTRSFVTTCPVCAREKPSNSPLAGLLNPLPIPYCFGSHIAMDFITGLPPDGNTTILTVVDHFFRAVHPYEE